MNVTLIGMGSGQPESLTLQSLAALRQADLILGARRLLAVLPAGCTENRAAAYRPDEVAELLQTSGAENAVLVYSGDTGFYSGAAALLHKLSALGIRARVLPGLSSVQLLAAALGRSWQDWDLVSAHGRACDPVAECMQGRPAFFLTGGSEDPATLCAQLAAEGFGEVEAVVGQCLGTPEEKIFRGSVKELAAGRFNSLSVLLVEAAEGLPRRTPGLPDEVFERGSVPMTKQEVRAAVLAKLAVRPEDILWDVGAGTGSVSVELALAAPRGRVYAVECRPEGCALIKANREKFRTRNLVLVEGLAPAALSDLPAPDAVVYLQVDPAVSQKLMTGRYHGDESRKDVHEKDTEYLARSRRAAEYCAEHLGWATVHCTVDGAMRTIEDIQAEVQALAGNVLG